MKIQTSFHIQNLSKAYQKNLRSVVKSESKTDTLSISTLAKDISIAQKAYHALPSIREDKVQEIKSLLDSGAYKPSASDLIDKILQK